jgi:23S rRNA pseudouridine1911/1915/1917 synthase
MFRMCMVKEDTIKAEGMPETIPDRISGESAAETDAPVMQTAKIGADEAGLRLDRTLAARLDGLSRSRLKTLILAGHVAIGGRTICDPGHRVNAGDEVSVVVPQAEPAEPQAEEIPLTIVHEDDDIVVIDKPRGLVVHPAAGNWTGTLVNALMAHCGTSLSGIGGVRRPGIVHRLDKDTTGLMVVAKNDRAHQSLAAQFADHGRTGPMQRGYLAFVWGAPDRPRGVIDKPIDRHPTVRDRMAVRPGGREAITLWEVVERYPVARESRPEGSDRTGTRGSRKGGDPAWVASLIDCHLRTGRTHQIRVHLAAIGHPLLGDDTYGPGFRTKTALLSEPAKTALEALSRQALHAYLLAIEHPATGEELIFRSELPPELARLRFVLGNG